MSAMSKTPDIITTFDLVRPDLRGRVVRLGGVLDEILDRHEYPAPVARLTAETILLAALLSSMLKYEGIFTLQAQGDGPLRLLVADMTSQGIIRGCASFRQEEIAAAAPDPFALLGDGHLVFTVDQAGGEDRYQGIVELRGKTLTECVQHYFRQSEQIQTGIRLAVGRAETGWRGGAIMLQRVPGTVGAADGGDDAESWRRGMMLLQTCTDRELLDPQLGEQDLVYRLFHEESIRIYEPRPLRHGCRCGPEKVANLLRSMSREEVDSLAQDGRIEMKCEFCGRSYTLNPDEIGGKEQEL